MTTITELTMNLSYSGGNFTYSTNTLTNEPPTWPITINAASGCTVTFLTNLTITSISQYFDVKCNDVTFEGNGHTVTISEITGGNTGYTGLIANGIGSSPSTMTSSGLSRCIIRNIHIHSSSSTLNTTSKNGWLCQVMFGCTSIGSTTDTQCEVSNCSSDGDMVSQSGGIAGATCYYTTFSNCFSTGAIGGLGSVGGGGIIGRLCKNCTINNCYSTGTIATSAGGIVGSNSTSCSVNNCYTIGEITTSGNGIFGSSSSGAATNNCIAFGDNIWSDTNANTTIAKNITSGDLLSTYSNNYNKTWTDISPTTTSTPYKLTSFNISPYSPRTLSLSSGITQTSSTPINSGTYSIVEVNGSSTIPPEITINSTTGVLTFTSVSPDGTYVILVYCVGSGNYTVGTYTLTIVTCLVKGTKIIKLIENENVQCFVEDLKMDDYIKTTSGPMKIKFIKSYEVHNIDLIKKINANSVDINIPNSDLYITNNHGILFNENDYNIYSGKSQPKQKITKIDNYFKLTAENFNKSEQIEDGELVLPVMCYNILLHDENKNETRCGIYANGLLVESMRPKIANIQKPKKKKLKNINLTIKN